MPFQVHWGIFIYKSKWNLFFQLNTVHCVKSNLWIILVSPNQLFC